MKKLLSLCAFALTLGLLIFVACKKEEVNQIDNNSSSGKIKEISLKNAYVKDGVFHFANQQSFKEAMTSLNSLNTESYLNYCDKNGIKTQQYYYIQLMKKLEHLSNTQNSNTELAIEELKKEYADILKFEMDYFEYKVQVVNFVSVLDRNGLVYINDVLYKFDEFGQITVNDGDLEKLKKATNNRNKEIEGVSFLQNKLNNKAAERGPCGFSINTGWITSASNDKRRGILSANQMVTLYAYPNSSQKDLEFSSDFLGRAQKKVLGAWWDYSTVHTLNANSNAQYIPFESAGFTVNVSFNQSVSANDTQIITYRHILSYWNNVSQSTFNNATSFLRSFNSINSTYSNQGGVNANLTCN